MYGGFGDIRGVEVLVRSLRFDKIAGSDFE